MIFAESFGRAAAKCLEEFANRGCPRCAFSVLRHDARLRFIKSETGVEVSLSEALPQKLVALFGSLCRHRNPSTGIIRAVSNHNPRTGLTVTPAGAHIYESHALPRRPGRYRHVNPPTVRARRVYPSVRSCCPSCP